MSCWWYEALQPLQVEAMSRSDRASKAETAFKLFDKNRDGYITKEEFTQVTHVTRVDAHLSFVWASFLADKFCKNNTAVSKF